ncbi:MAG: alanine--tRNA ligase [archaeon]|nr:alanine--tRNA ligase [archaeon]
MVKITKRQELIKKYIEFFKSKGHKEIPGASLVPANDPTVLFTTAGMHPLVPFLLGERHPLGKKLVDVQKCIRTGDIEEVGDNFHLTFFEMLGNWSLGDYTGKVDFPVPPAFQELNAAGFKKEAIAYSFEFLTKELKIPVEQLSVTCFRGDKDASKDVEASEIWKSLGIKIEKIKFLSKEDNWWGPAGNTGPCGPDTEMFVNGCEIWNDVFMQYVKDEKGKYNVAKQKNVDTGMGVERTIAILNGMKSVYETSAFVPIIKKIEKLSGKNKLTDNVSTRIIADHIKASIFLMADGVVPSNVERGYVLRRLIRRAIRHGNLIGIKENFTTKLVDSVIEIYSDYGELDKNRNLIITELDKEETKFRQTLESGIREFEKIIKNKKELHCKEVFLLYQSYGFPIEMIEELAKEKKIKIDKQGFEKECKLHQELSRTASAGQFKSGLGDNSEQTKKLHTATHLLNEALREVLGDKTIAQRGSNINAERLRFDFNFPRKLTDIELVKIEDWVNDKIKRKISVERKELPLKEALKSGAQGEFGAKYPEVVSVYLIKDCSNEICSGPHVENIGDLGKFKIIKEESSSAGVRRIKATLS